jgi:hypothetical protein
MGAAWEVVSAVFLLRRLPTCSVSAAMVGASENSPRYHLPAYASPLQSRGADVGQSRVVGLQTAPSAAMTSSAAASTPCRTGLF